MNSQQAFASQLLIASVATLRSSTETTLNVLQDPLDPPQKIMLEVLAPSCNVDKLRLNLATSATPTRDTHTDTLGIIWELIDNSSTKQSLNITCVETFSDTLKAAVAFETEYGSNMTLISRAVSCLKDCLDALRLHNAGYLTPAAHYTCSKGGCKLDCINSFTNNNNQYLEEIARLFLHERRHLQPDKRWWLSWFYSLWIRAYVRRAMVTIEKQLKSPTLPDGLGRWSSPTYFHLGVQVFRTAARGEDPLIHSWTVDELPALLNSTAYDLRVLKYMRYAQRALHTADWPLSGIQSSYDFLDRMFDGGDGRDPDSAQTVRPYPEFSTVTQTPPVSDAHGQAVSHTSFASAFLKPGYTASPDLSIGDDRRSSDILGSSPMANQLNQTYDPDTGLASAGKKRAASSPPLFDDPWSSGVVSQPVLAMDTSLLMRLGADSDADPESISPAQSQASGQYPRRIESSESLRKLSRSKSSRTNSPGNRPSPAIAVPRTESSDSLVNNMNGWNILKPRSPTQSVDSASSLESPRVARFVNQHPPPFGGTIQVQTVPPPQTQTLANPARHFSTTGHTCSCCPKKPKTFDTITELRAHEAEKTFECPTCHNRFKNKNEAERHRNTLHVRPYSWSCSILADPATAFHPDPTAPGFDACGYCGQQFRKNGGYPLEERLAERIEHVKNTHRFGKCNAAKKFYRADHFRQHLKHSHAGTSGPWTNVLEDACRVHEGGSGSGESGASRARSVS